MAKSEEEIKRCMELPQSSLAYIITAQPLKKDTRPFILQIFGTNNQFTAENVAKRWRYTEAELKM